MLRKSGRLSKRLLNFLKSENHERLRSLYSLSDQGSFSFGGDLESNLPNSSIVEKCGSARPHVFADHLRMRELQKLYDIAFSCLWARGSKGDYHEYGCYQAKSFRMALSYAHKYDLSDMNFFGFDSFQGLPTDGTRAMCEEDFMSLIKGHGIYSDRVRTIPGFYDQSLNSQLQRQFIQNENPISFVNIDCDLHDSALPIFDFIEPLLENGAIIYLDDFFSTFKHGPEVWGTAKAFFEFIEKSKFDCYQFHPVGFWGQSFLVYNWD